MMKIDILTVFPGMFKPVLGESIIKRAAHAGIVALQAHNLRDYSTGKHRRVDDKPFGGGPGMVMMAQPIFSAVEGLIGKKGLSDKRQVRRRGFRTVLLTPQGRRLDQRTVNRLSKSRRIILICGRYEGVDERVRKIITDEISIGDYVLTGGELPAMVLIDAMVRQLPGALGDKDSARYDSFQTGLIEHPHYTRPRSFREMMAPKVLLSGNHDKIEGWRQKQSIERTRKRRPDLLK